MFISFIILKVVVSWLETVKILASKVAAVNGVQYVPPSPPPLALFLWRPKNTSKIKRRRCPNIRVSSLYYILFDLRSRGAWLGPYLLIRVRNTVANRLVSGALFLLFLFFNYERTYLLRPSSVGTPNAVVTMGRTIATTTLTAAQLQQLAAARGQVRSETQLIIILCWQLPPPRSQPRSSSSWQLPGDRSDNN